MGLRLRKSVKLGPFRVNFSKSGVGYSYGVKGYRVTHKADGGVRTTASIPGTGVSYVTEKSAKKVQTEKSVSSNFSSSSHVYQSQPKPEGRYVQMTGKDGRPYYVSYIRCPFCGQEALETSEKCPHCGKKLNASKGGGKAPKIAAALLAGAVALGGAGALLGGNDEPAPTPVPDPTPIVQPVDPAPVPEPEPVVDEPPVTAEPEPAPDPTPAPAPVTPEPAPEPEVVDPAPSVSEEKTVHYIGNKNSKKLHETWCDSVDKMKEENKIEFTSRNDAIALGYEPCQNCTP